MHYYANNILKPDNKVLTAINENTEEGKNTLHKLKSLVLKNIEQSTMRTDSEDDFIRLFEDLDLTSSKLGKAVRPQKLIYFFSYD